MHSQQPIEQARAAVDFKKITITLDGTPEGVTISINGEKVENLSSVYLSQMSDPAYGSYISLSFSTAEDPKNIKPGQIAQTHTFRLVPRTSEKAVASMDVMCGIGPELITPEIARKIYSKM